MEGLRHMAKSCERLNCREKLFIGWLDKMDRRIKKCRQKVCVGQPGVLAEALKNDPAKKNFLHECDACRCQERFSAARERFRHRQTKKWTERSGKRHERYEYDHGANRQPGADDNVPYGASLGRQAQLL